MGVVALVIVITRGGGGDANIYVSRTLRLSKAGLTWVTFSHTLGGEEDPLILVAGLGEEAPCIGLGRHSGK